MSRWLVLGRKREDPWVNGLLQKGPDLARLGRVPGFKDLEDKEIVLDLFSDMALKEQALRAIAQCSEWNGPVASHLTRGSSTEWAMRSGLGARLVGFLLCPAPDEMRSAELLRNECTDDHALSRVRSMLEQLGLLSSVCRDQAGGILPRTLASMINEAAYSALYGVATPEEIDRMMKLGANFPYGPFEWADRIGLHRILQLLEAMREELGPHYQPCPWIRRKVEAGKLGVETGEGFYVYGPGGAP